MIEFLIKKTTDLTDNEINRICLLFKEIFVNHSKSIVEFKNEFLNTALGFSFHALMVNNGEIIGSHSLIPCHYNMNRISFLAAFSVDTMIKKGYRDFFNLKDMVELAEREASKYGVRFIFGFPNDNSYPVLKKGLKYKDIGRMSTYIYPYRIGGIKSNLRLLNFLSIAFCRFREGISAFLINKKVYDFCLDKDRSSYNLYRYQWFDGLYKIVTLDDFQFVYKIITYNNIRTAFLIDIDKISSFNIHCAVSYIRQKERRNFDLLMYIGYLPCRSLPFIKLPHKFEPKNFNFIGKFLDQNSQDERLFNIRNWNVNLSCYDLI